MTISRNFRSIIMSLREPGDKAPRQPWARADTYSQVLDLNRRYLQGSLSTSPTYCGPIDEETLPLVSGLLQMHDYGFLTTNSQPSAAENFQGRQWESRGYVQFLVPTEDDFVPTGDEFPAALVEAFCDELLKLEQIFVVVRNDYGEVIRHNQPVDWLPLHQSRSESEQWKEEMGTSSNLLEDPSGIEA